MRRSCFGGDVTARCPIFDGYLDARPSSRGYTEVMKISSDLALSAALVFAAGCVSTVRNAAPGESALDAQSRWELAEQVVLGWAYTPRMAARLLMESYGSPDEVGSSRLVWHGNGPWKRTIVRDLPIPYVGGATDDLGVIEQTVSYRLSLEQAADLAVFSDRLKGDPASMELSSRADREGVNILRLNLANDVVRRLLTAEEAKDSYARVLTLEAAGKTQRYMLGLRFGYAP